MASIQTDPQCDTRKKVTCDVPRCQDTRRARGQLNGRWLMTVEFDGNRSVTITTKCQECGGTHSVMLAIPPSP